DGGELVEGGVGAADEGEEGREGGGDVEVVVEAALEVGEGRGGEVWERRGRGVVADGRGGEPVVEVEETADGGACLREALEGEVQLLAVVGGEELEANGGGFVALLDEGAECDDVAEGLGHLLGVEQEEA